MSSLAFACGTPQSPPTEEQFKEFATGINGGTDMTFGELAALRRLHFEASAIVMAELSLGLQTPQVKQGESSQWPRRRPGSGIKKPDFLA